MRGNRDARLLGLYLLTAPGANEIGLYYLPFVTLCHETGLAPEEAQAALRVCSEAKFAHYDEDAELVWVPNAAEKRFGSTLSAKDNNRKWIARQVAAHGNHRFVRQFMARYGIGYGLIPNLESQGSDPHTPKGVLEGVRNPPSTLLYSPLGSPPPGSGVCDPDFNSSDLNGSTPPVAIPPESTIGVHETAEPETAKVRYVKAYCAGISQGKGGPYAWSGNAYDMGELGQIISVFAHESKTKKPLRGERLLGWIEAAACDFATWVGEQKDPDTHRYYSGYRPKGCLKFLNEQERGEEARRVG